MMCVWVVKIFTTAKSAKQVLFAGAILKSELPAFGKRLIFLARHPIFTGAVLRVRLPALFAGRATGTSPGHGLLLLRLSAEPCWCEIPNKVRRWPLIQPCRLHIQTPRAVPGSVHSRENP